MSTASHTPVAQARTSQARVAHIAWAVVFARAGWQVRAIVRAASRDDYRFAALVVGIVNSNAFRLQALPHVGGAGVTASVRDRDEEPAHYWLAVLSKFLMFPVGAAMIWMSSDILWR